MGFGPAAPLSVQDDPVLLMRRFVRRPCQNGDEVAALCATANSRAGP